MEDFILEFNLVKDAREKCNIIPIRPQNSLKWPIFEKIDHDRKKLIYMFPRVKFDDTFKNRTYFSLKTRESANFGHF